MRILVDADACPVMDIIEEKSKENALELKIYSDIYHRQSNSYGEIIRVDSENQSADMAIFNDCKKGDIVITQDYGLAALVLSKSARALNFNGRIFSDDNINHLLMRRHVHAKIRKAGGRHSTAKKRTEEDDHKFAISFEKIIKSSS